MSESLTTAVYLEKLIDLSDLTLKLHVEKDTLLLDRIVKLVDLITVKYNALTVVDGRKSKKFKDAQAVLRNSYATQIDNICELCEGLLQECGVTPLTHFVHEGNPIGKQDKHIAIRALYTQILETVLRFTVVLQGLEG